jgi:hypothetical protein
VGDGDTLKAVKIFNTMDARVIEVPMPEPIANAYNAVDGDDAGVS